MLDFSWFPQLADMIRKVLAFIRSQAKPDFLMIGLPALVIILGVIGYSRLEFTGTFHSITNIFFSTLNAFKATFKAENPSNHFTDLAAIFGAVFLYYWLAALVFTTVRETGEKALARLFTWNEVVLVGDTDFLTRADKIWRSDGVHPLRIVSADKPAPPDWASRRVRAAFDDTIVNGFALHRVKRVMIDLGEDMQTLTLAFQLLSSVAAQTKGRKQDSEWIIVVRNAALADHFAMKVRALFCTGANRPPMPDLHYLHPERVAARYFMAQHPLFLLAEKRGQGRVHALVIGDGPITRHLIEMTFLTPLTAGLETPAVTVLTPHPDAERSAFFSGRPALAEAIDILFIDVAAMDGFERAEGEAAKQLDERETQMPFTTAFLVSGDTQENVRVALLLSRIQRKMSRLCCEIFSYEENVAEAEFLKDSEDTKKKKSGGFKKAIGGFEVFGLTDAYLTQQICDAGKRDLLPRALHERYRRNTDKPVESWNELAESLRRANRNAADHWLAKMHMLGFNVDGIEPGTLAKLRQNDADDILKQPVEAGADGSLSPMAATIRSEHDRWMIERHLDGWAHGPKRDNDKQIHDLLVPWDVLKRDFPNEIAKDADQIVAVVESLVTNGDPKFVLERKKTTEQAPSRGVNLLRDNGTPEVL